MTSLEDRDTVIRLIGGYMIANAIRAAGHLHIFARLGRVSLFAKPDGDGA